MNIPACIKINSHLRGRHYLGEREKNVASSENRFVQGPLVNVNVKDEISINSKRVPWNDRVPQLYEV